MEDNGEPCAEDCIACLHYQQVARRLKATEEWQNPRSINETTYHKFLKGYHVIRGALDAGRKSVFVDA